MVFDDATLNRFWSKVDKRGPDDCWEWTAGLTSTGYGCFVTHPPHRKHKASRFSLLLVSSPPDDIRNLACHTCDNPKCVNPAHLYWGSKSENMRDALTRKEGFLDKIRDSQRQAAYRRKVLSDWDELAVWKLLEAGHSALGISKDLGISLIVVRGISLKGNHPKRLGCRSSYEAVYTRRE
jgi:hypothetical protein